MTALATEFSGRPIRFYSKPWFRPLIGVVLLVGLLVAAPIYGRLTSDGKISPDISRDAAVVEVIVDLPVDLLTFHREELSEIGVFSGRDRNNLGDRSRVRLQNVTQEGLEQMANLYWVESIEPA